MLSVSLSFWICVELRTDQTSLEVLFPGHFLFRTGKGRQSDMTRRVIQTESCFFNVSCVSSFFFYCGLFFYSVSRLDLSLNGFHNFNMFLIFY